ncbi:hypothetical protein [Ilyomonas limi]|uniref:hypothetical protein n=1 Tax=Ilyomonas limi TaxID=2575867 RepID=UPI0014850DBD|nr:hypothetical protein [Ilyomonas limi]
MTVAGRQLTDSALPKAVLFAPANGVTGKPVHSIEPGTSYYLLLYLVVVRLRYTQ